MLFYNKIHNKLHLFIFFIKIYMIQQIILILNKKAVFQIANILQHNKPLFREFFRTCFGGGGVG